MQSEHLDTLHKKICFHGANLLTSEPLTGHITTVEIPAVMHECVGCVCACGGASGKLAAYFGLLER